MTNRLLHHAEVIALNGDFYRLTNRELGRSPRQSEDKPSNPGISFQPERDHFLAHGSYGRRCTRPRLPARRLGSSTGSACGGVPGTVGVLGVVLQAVPW